MRRTKITATIGPACETPEKIEELIHAGVDVFRFNTKHGTIEWHSQRMVWVEEVAKKINKTVAILLDLQGPEVRIDGVPEYLEQVTKGQRFRLVEIGEEGVALDHPQVFRELKEGMKVFIDDGMVELVVVETNERWAEVEVVEGEVIKNRKTVNFPGVKLDFPTLVDQDLEKLSLTRRHHIDYVGLSFVRRVEDIRTLRRELVKLEVECGIIAKIEHPEAVTNFDAILAESDGIMVARGDLGIEYPMEEVPGLQKFMVRRCREEGKPVIVATQMLESMTINVRPTRAEVSDVANAVYDSCDSVMLSGETASGKHPLRVVQTMRRIVERIDGENEPVGVVTAEGRNQTEALIKAASDLVKGSDDYRALVVLTESGTKARCLSRLRPRVPIVALSRNTKTVDQLMLSWGVIPYLFEYKKTDRVSKLAIGSLLRRKGIMKRGKYILVYGNVAGDSGKTSVVRVMEVGD